MLTDSRNAALEGGKGSQPFGEKEVKKDRESISSVFAQHRNCFNLLLPVFELLLHVAVAHE